MATLTEDISLRVTGMLFQQIIRALDYGTTVAPGMVQLANAEINYGTKALTNIAKNIKKNKAEEKIRNLINDKGEINIGQMDELLKLCEVQPRTIKVATEDAKRFESLINRDGVLYAKIDMKEDNCKMYVHLDSESDKVLNAYNIVYAERGHLTELPPALFMEAGGSSSIKEIGGLDNVELELFRYYAKKKNFLFTVIPGNDNNTVIVNTSEDDKMTSVQKSNAVQRTMTEIGWALTGNKGARVREQIEYRLAGRTKLLKSIDDAEKELYVVSKNNPNDFVRISYDELEVYKDKKLLNKVERRENNMEEYRVECLSACESITYPVLLTAEEFQRGVTLETLANKQTIDLFDSSFNEVIEDYSMNEMIRLVQKGLKDKQKKNEADDKQKEAIDKHNKRIKDATDKMTLDDEFDTNINPWNEGVTYSEFARYENISDDDERAAREDQFDHFKNAAFYSNRNFEVTDHVLEGNIDVIIEKASQKRREREAAATRMRDSIVNDKESQQPQEYI